MEEKLTVLANWLQAEGQKIDGVVVQGVSIDSRTVQQGDLFIPFRGEQMNGHQFVRSAIEKGAVASLWLKDEPNPPADLPLVFVEDAEKALQQLARTYRKQLNCKVIGITGSNGKTSTKDLVASVLMPYYKVQKTEGNYNNELGLPLTILSIKKETEVAVLEMGMSNFGEISFLSTLAEPDIAVITNIGEAHMQDLGSREGIAQAKLEIVDGLKDNGVFLYDGDESLLKERIQTTESYQIYSFGNEIDNDIKLEAVEVTDAGSEFKVTGLLAGSFTIPVFGKHQVKNALVAMAIGHRFNLTKDQIKQSLLAARLTEMRMEPIHAKNGALFINDAYNAAPTSMQAALAFLKETTIRPEKWVVLADMLELGANERQYHEAIYKQLMEMDLKGILLYGPRMKWLYNILQKKAWQGHLLWSEADYLPLQNLLEGKTNEQSVVLLKGSRGMTLEKIVEYF